MANKLHSASAVDRIFQLVIMRGWFACVCFEDVVSASSSWQLLIDRTTSLSACRVMFLQPLKRAVKSRAGSRCCRAGVPKAQERYFVPVWVEPEELMSEGILVSSYMLEDHTPGVMLQQLQLLIDAQEQSGGAPAAGAGGAAAVAAAEAAV